MAETIKNFGAGRPVNEKKGRLNIFSPDIKSTKAKVEESVNRTSKNKKQKDIFTKMTNDERILLREAQNYSQWVNALIDLAHKRTEP